MVRSTTPMEAQCLQTSSQLIQKDPSSEASKFTAFFTSGCSFHLSLVSLQSPVHSPVPQGLRIFTRRCTFLTLLTAKMLYAWPLTKPPTPLAPEADRTLFILLYFARISNIFSWSMVSSRGWYAHLRRSLSS